MRFAKKKILIADDSQGFILYLSVLLNRMGFSVIPAESGLEALKLINLRMPDLVLLDLHMPDLNGIDALKKIRGEVRTRNIPVVMVSADDSAEYKKEADRLGCSGYLLKPVDIGQLHKALQENLIVPSGQMRRNLRVEYSGRVRVTSGDTEEELFAQSISGDGIYIMKKGPLPVGTELDMHITLGEDSDMDLQGTVIYINPMQSDSNSTPQGMAVEFRDVRPGDAKILEGFVKGLLKK